LSLLDHTFSSKLRLKTDTEKILRVCFDERSIGHFSVMISGWWPNCFWI